MKKFLLIAFAALFVGTANAQLVKKQATSKPQTGHNHVLPQATSKKYEVAPAKQVKAVADKSVKKLQATQSLKNVLTPATKSINKVNRAGTVMPEYEGTGVDLSDGAVEWTMFSGTATFTDGTTATVLQDVIPDPFGFENGVAVEYTLSGNDIIIAPQLVASSTSGDMFVYLLDGKSADGTITLTMDNDGKITGTYEILYGAYSQETNDVNDMSIYLGYYAYVQNIKYNIPGNIAAPEVSFEPNNLVLFAGIGLNGYAFTNNLAITSAYAPLSFRNLTTDKATTWQWSASRLSGDDEAETLTGDEREFEFNTVGGDAYTNIQLVGVNQTLSSEPFTFGVGKSSYENSYIYAGGYEGEFMLNGETPAIITRQDPDGDLTFYTNWGTPDIYTNASVSKIYCYHEKPSAPLYIEGVTLPLVNSNYNSNFNLHIKIYEATYPNGASRPTLGRILAEGDATNANVNADFNIGLTAIEFTELYVEDEFGLSEALDYLFIDTEFVIVIEGWDNGTFSGVLGSQDVPLANARKSTWFEKTGEEGSWYSYNGWNTCLLVGLLGAVDGYLYTEDDTNVTIPAEGGQVALNVKPMFSNVEANANGSKTRLWLDYTSEDIPEWLTVGFANEDYTSSFTFDLVFQAEAMPAGVDSRSAELVFAQEGARLIVNVTQGGTGTGITTTVTKVTEDGKTYDLSGRVMKAGQKGLAIKNGKKYIVK